MPGSRRSTVVGGVLLMMCATLTGCSRPVAVDDPSPSGTDRDTCIRLMADLPELVLDQERRSAQPGTFSAAWGEEVITLRCGVAKPPDLNAASQCLEVNGVGWFAERAEGGYLFTTLGRQTYVELAVPASYAPEAGALVDLAATTARNNRLVKACV